MLVLMMIIMFIFDKLSRKWEVRQWKNQSQKFSHVS
jgi:hypothetical protein